MAVSIQVFSVIARNSTLKGKLPCGVQDFMDACPNNTFCTDGMISRIGFMSLEDASDFIGWMRSVGFIPLEAGKSRDVALTNCVVGFLFPCDWLTISDFEGNPVAWLKESGPGEVFIPEFELDAATNHFTAKEFHERFEFVEVKNQVEVFREKNTGKLIYIGRTKNPDEISPGEDIASDELSEADRQFNMTFETAWNLIENRIVIDGKTLRKKPGWFDRRHLRKAHHLFSRCLELEPRHWPSRLMIGKIRERLGDYRSALDVYQLALEIDPGNSSIIKEISVAAFNLGKFDIAKEWSQIAIRMDPDDSALHSNLGVSYLMEGRLDAAMREFKTSDRLEPENQLPKALIRLAESIQSGRTAVPKSIRELNHALGIRA
jgi:tetratricopeptide (TPR) repeat protein